MNLTGIWFLGMERGMMVIWGVENGPELQKKKIENW
jgi:hypothetical protein